MTDAERFPRFRAPRENGSTLCVPAWEELPQILTKSSDAGASENGSILDHTIEEIRRAARSELLQAASLYTNSYADKPVEASTGGPLILSGHQPDLVHPGVWLKNFAAAKLARQTSGTSISLIIDNDLCRAPSIRVPTGTVDDPRVANVAFDRPAEQLPFEDREILDRSLWETFAERVAETIALLVPNSLLADWWPSVMARSQEVPHLGLAIAQARHQLELRWGAKGLELPQSAVCRTESFRKFALHLWLHAEAFRVAYNGALLAYRQSHNIRSPAQPVPDLESNHDWTETPFWVWTAANRKRRTLFVRRTSEQLQFSDQEDWQDELPCANGVGLSNCLVKLESWEDDGVKIRSKALITTLFARLLVGDTFVHGIGGAKYDQVTNLLCESFFGVALPAYVTISGTLHLPICHRSCSSKQITEGRQTLRRLRYHPELFLSQVSLEDGLEEEASKWVAKKQEWVQYPKTSENAAERHRHIEGANLRLQGIVEPLRISAERNLAEAIGQFRANKVLESREYAFCLFPLETLQDFLLDF